MGLKVQKMRAKRLPVTKTREFSILMGMLEMCKKQTLKGETLKSVVGKFLSESGFSLETNIWTGLFESILGHYLIESMDSRLPIENFLDYIYDSARDIRQMQQMEAGKIRLSTMHAAKGLEFPVVIVAGYPVGTGPLEDERRLYYVAMTRAMRKLYLFHDERPHPFIRDISGMKDIVRTVARPVTGEKDHKAFHTRIWELGIDDVVISFPAYSYFIEYSQKSLARLEPGISSELKFDIDEGNCRIKYHDRAIAKLSAKAVKHCNAEFISKNYQASKVIFLASIHWSKTEKSEGFQNFEAADRWYTGLFQILFERC